MISFSALARESFRVTANRLKGIVHPTVQIMSLIKVLQVWNDMRLSNY